MSFNNILLNYKIISCIQEGEKLDIKEIANGKKCGISSNSLFHNLYRWYSGSSREKTIIYLNELLRDSQKVIIDNNKTKDMDILISLQQLEKEMRNSVVGLKKLKITYQNDIPTCSEIDLVVENIGKELLKLCTHKELKFIEKSG